MQQFRNLQRPLVPNYATTSPGDLLSVHGNIFRIGNANCDGHYIYVVLPCNNPFGGNFSDHNGNEIDVHVSKMHHHDDLARGLPVNYAGTLDFDNGVLTEWSNHSGHYQPFAIYRDQAPTAFDSRLFAAVTNDGSLASFNPASPHYVG